MGRPSRSEVEGQDPHPRSAGLGHDARGLGIHPGEVREGDGLARGRLRVARPAGRPDQGVRLQPILLYEKIVRQEGLLTIWDLPDTLLERERGSPLQYVFPKSGTPVIDDAVGVVAGSRHAETAKRFVDFLGSKPLQRLAAEKTYRLPARMDMGDDLPQWARDVDREWCRPTSTGRSSTTRRRVDGDVGPDHPRQGSLRPRAVKSTVRRLLPHHVVKTFLFERLLLTASATLAVAAVAMGRVRISEIPGLMDARLLTLFFVLTIAVELGKDSDLFDRLVVAVARRAGSARGLAYGMVGASGVLAAVLTNDVALFLVVPFTMLFRKVADLELAPIVVLEIAAANLIGSASPIGNPQNLFLYTRGHFTPGAFFANQAPWVAVSAVLLAVAVPVLVPKRRLVPPATEKFDVHPGLAAACLVLLALEIASVFDLLDHRVPLVLAIGGAALLGRRIRETDFSLVFVFAFLFVGIAGLERGRLYSSLDPVRLFGHQARGLVLSGALLSQLVSNVPAAMLLAPAAASAAAFGALLHGVNTGGCGTPIASLANLIGAQLYAREGGDLRRFWRRFLPVNAVLLVLLLAASLVLVSD